MTTVCTSYPVNAQQKCLADLRRHFKSPQIRPWQQPSPRANLLELIDEAFTKHRQWRQTQDTVLTKLGQRLQVTSATEHPVDRSSGVRGGSLLRSLRDKAEQWWYFLDHPEVPPDNNLAERSLRLAVTKRKVGGVTLNGQVRSDS